MHVLSQQYTRIWNIYWYSSLHFDENELSHQPYGMQQQFYISEGASWSWWFHFQNVKLIISVSEMLFTIIVTYNKQVCMKGFNFWTLCLSSRQLGVRRAFMLCIKHWSIENHRLCTAIAPFWVSCSADDEFSHWHVNLSVWSGVDQTWSIHVSPPMLLITSSLLHPFFPLNQLGLISITIPPILLQTFPFL